MEEERGVVYITHSGHLNNKNLGSSDAHMKSVALEAIKTNKWWKLIIFGQVLALLLTGTGVFSELLAGAGADIPCFQSLCNYLLLTLFWFRTGLRRPEVAIWKYFVVALCDVEGNYLLVMAYQYTTITSVQLLDCFTIP